MDQITIKKCVTVKLPAVELFGDITHVPAEQMLMVNMPETQAQYADTEVLSTNTDDSLLIAQEAAKAGADLQRVVTIKDYSEHAGLAESLVRLGAIRRLAEYTTGPFSSKIVIAEVVYPDAPVMQKVETSEF